MTIGRAVLLVGSAKPSGTSTSESLGRYLLNRIADRGVVTTVLHVNRSAAGHDDDRLVAALAQANLFIVATPLYVDSLPYLVTRTFESLARLGPSVRDQPCAFVALVNCGFPEAEHCATALEIARAFARRAGFVWAGGFALGEGGAIDGRSLEDCRGLARHLRHALDVSAAALADGLPVPDTERAAFAHPLMPARLYTLTGDFGWRLRARRNGVRSQLRARPLTSARD